MTSSWGLAIKSLREAKGLTQQELAGLIGIKQSLLAHYENGYVKTFDNARLPRFASALGITSAELTAKMDTAIKRDKGVSQTPKPSAELSWPPMPVVAIPVIGSVPAGYLDVRTEEVSGYVYVLQESIKGMKKENLKALLVTGESMIGDGIQHKDFVVFALSETHIINGKIYIVQSEEYGVTIKHAYKEDSQLRLKASNPDFDDIILDNATIIGRVILTTRQAEL